MASPVIHSTRRTSDEPLARSSPGQHHARDCRREEPSREEFVARFQHLRDDTVPEMERIERMLTRVAIAYGLQYCHLDLVAKSFLDLSREMRGLLVETKQAVLCDEPSSCALKSAQQSTASSLERFRDVITSDLTCQESTPVYRRLIASLLEFEAGLSQVFERAAD